MLFKTALRKASELGLALTAISILILAGCGGGSSSPGGSSAATTTTTVTPFKGMFTNGFVTLLDADGNPITLVSGGSINASGVASVTYPASVIYPLTVQVTGDFLDETSGVGATGTISSPLLGLIPAASDAAAASGVPVTVVTHMARTMLPASGVTAASAVAAITGAASSVLGVSSYNLAMKPPVFNSLGKTADPMTIKLAALANVIGLNGSGTDLGAKLLDIANKLKAGSAVNAVFPPADFSSALTAVNYGGASSVLPASATIAVNIPAYTMPGSPLGNMIAAGIPPCSAGQVLQVTATGLICGGTHASLLGSWKMMSRTLNATSATETTSSSNMILNLPANGNWTFTQTPTCQQSGTSTSNATTFTFTVVNDPCNEPTTAGLVVTYNYTISGTTLTGNNGTYTYNYEKQSAATPTLTSFTPPLGAVGTSVTITGTNFSANPANNTVNFNGAAVAASVISATATQLVVTVPETATTGTVTVTVGGQTATSATGFTVTAGGGGGATAYASCTMPSLGMCTAYIGSFFTGSATGSGGPAGGDMQSGCPASIGGIWAVSSNCSTANRVGACRGNVGLINEFQQTYYPPAVVSTVQAACVAPNVWVP